MAYTRKTHYEFTLWANYGQGMEELTSETTRVAILERLKEYRLNAPGIAYTLTKKRVSNAKAH